MARLIKRYGSRKLYDTEESRYVSLEDVAAWVRDGQEIQVQDNASQEDVTVATLTQVISEEGRKGAAFLPSDLLHNLIRIGGQAVTSRVRKFQSGVDRLMKNSIDTLVPVTGVREEMQLLRQRLDELEHALSHAENTSTEAEKTQEKASASSKGASTASAPAKPEAKPAAKAGAPRKAKAPAKKATTTARKKTSTTSTTAKKTTGTKKSTTTRKPATKTTGRTKATSNQGVSS